MKKMLMLTILVVTTLLFSGCARKNPLAECDKLKPTYEEVKRYGTIDAYDLARMKKQEDCRERVMRLQK